MASHDFPRSPRTTARRLERPLARLGVFGLLIGLALAVSFTIHCGVIR